MPTRSYCLPLSRAVIAGVMLAAALQGCEKRQECAFIATEDQATKLLTKLMPESKLISFERLPLDDKSDSCLLEVDMLANKDDEQTRGFVYVLPDGERFLNGPLMDRRSRLVISSNAGLSPELKEAIQAQQATLKSVQDKLSTLQQEASLPSIPDAQNLALPAAYAPNTQPDPEAHEKEQIAWRAFLEKVKALPSLQTQASGSDVYVMFDPLCSYCSLLYKQHEELSHNYGLRFHWIPMFLSDKGWAMSAHLLKTGRLSSQEGLELLDKMLKKTWKPADDAQALKSLTEEDYGYAKKASLEFYEQSKLDPQLGTPLVLFVTPSGDVKHIAGVPERTDWEVFATRESRQP